VSQDTGRTVRKCDRRQCHHQDESERRLTQRAEVDLCHHEFILFCSGIMTLYTCGTHFALHRTEWLREVDQKNQKILNKIATMRHRGGDYSQEKLRPKPKVSAGHLANRKREWDRIHRENQVEFLVLFLHLLSALHIMLLVPAYENTAECLT